MDYSTPTMYIALVLNKQTYYTVRIYQSEPTLEEGDAIIRLYTTNTVSEYLLALEELLALQTELIKGDSNE